MSFSGPQNSAAGPKKSWSFWGLSTPARAPRAEGVNARVLMRLGYGEAHNGGQPHSAGFPYFCEGHCQSTMHAAGTMRVSVKRDPLHPGTYNNTHAWANWCAGCFQTLTESMDEYDASLAVSHALPSLSEQWAASHPRAWRRPSTSLLRWRPLALAQLPAQLMTQVQAQSQTTTTSRTRSVR